MPEYKDVVSAHKQSRDKYNEYHRDIVAIAASFLKALGELGFTRGDNLKPLPISINANSEKARANTWTVPGALEIDENSDGFYVLGIVLRFAPAHVIAGGDSFHIGIGFRRIDGFYEVKFGSTYRFRADDGENLEKNLKEAASLMLSDFIDYYDNSLDSWIAGKANKRLGFKT